MGPNGPTFTLRVKRSLWQRIRRLFGYRDWWEGLSETSEDTAKPLSPEELARGFKNIERHGQ